MTDMNNRSMNDNNENRITIRKKKNEKESKSSRYCIMRSSGRRTCSRFF